MNWDLTLLPRKLAKQCKRPAVLFVLVISKSSANMGKESSNSSTLNFGWLTTRDDSFAAKCLECVCRDRRVLVWHSTPWRESKQALVCPPTKLHAPCNNLNDIFHLLTNKTSKVLVPATRFWHGSKLQPLHSYFKHILLQLPRCTDPIYPEPEIGHPSPAKT